MDQHVRAVLARLPLDGWDFVGLAALVLLARGIFTLWGIGWAQVALGVIVLCLYALREWRLGMKREG